MEAPVNGRKKCTFLVDVPSLRIYQHWSLVVNLLLHYFLLLHSVFYVTQVAAASITVTVYGQLFLQFQHCQVPFINHHSSRAVSSHYWHNHNRKSPCILTKLNERWNTKTGTLLFVGAQMPVKVYKEQREKNRQTTLENKINKNIWAKLYTVQCGWPHHMIQNTASTWTDTVDNQC